MSEQVYYTRLENLPSDPISQECPKNKPFANTIKNAQVGWLVHFDDLMMAVLELRSVVSVGMLGFWNDRDLLEVFS